MGDAMLTQNGNIIFSICKPVIGRVTPHRSGINTCKAPRTPKRIPRCPPVLANKKAPFGVFCHLFRPISQLCDYNVFTHLLREQVINLLEHIAPVFP